MCRNERFVREPSLETALAYEVIFQQPIRELFRGLFRKIEKDVAARAGALAYSRRSSRHRTAVRGEWFNLATDFAPRERFWWEGKGIKVPDAKLFLGSSRFVMGKKCSKTDPR